MSGSTPHPIPGIQSRMLRHILFAALLPMAQINLADGPPKPVTIASLRDDYRPLLIFSPTDGDPRLTRQTLLKDRHQPGLADRQIILIPMYLNTPYTGGIAMFPDGKLGSISKPEADAARRRFHIAPTDFTVILLGKDGGEKLRSHDPIPFATLRDTIDAMPMRQDEMKQPH